MSKIDVKTRHYVRKYAVSKLRLNGFYSLNSKNIINNKFKDIFEFYKEKFGRDPYCDYMYVEKELDKNAKNLAIKEKINKVDDGQYVYVIGNLIYNVCKIGYSKNPISRLKTLQTGCPYKLQLILIIQGNITIEKQLHKKYRKYKTNGEWFNLVGDLKESIEKSMLSDKNIAMQF